MENTMNRNDTLLSMQRGMLQKEEIYERLRTKGCRITKQREILIDIILQNDCTCCKEIYYLAAKKMPDIGIATIYRMVNTLEEIGAIQRGNAYRICCPKGMTVPGCVVELEKCGRVELNEKSLRCVLQKGMEACGYMQNDKVKKVTVKCS